MKVHITDSDGQLHEFTDASEAGTKDDAVYVIYTSPHTKYVDKLAEFPDGTLERIR